MAHTITKFGEKPNVMYWEIFCDTDADIAKLPAAPLGSRAIVVSNGNLYLVDSAGVWHAMPGNEEVEEEE